MITLTGVMTCDVCGEAACLDCHPDALVRCADDVSVHHPGDDCKVCDSEAAAEFQAEVQADIDRHGAI